MGVLDSYKVNRAIHLLLSAPDASEPERRQALMTLKQLSGRAVPRLVEALADPESPAGVPDLLLALLDNDTLPLVSAGLSSSNARVASRVADVLCRGGNYDPNRLLDQLQDSTVPKARLIDVLSRHRHSLNPNALLGLLDTIDKESRSLVLRLVDEAATESFVPELIRLTAKEDWLTRLYAARTLRRFSTEAVREALTRLLKDPHKSVRQAALEGLAGLHVPVDVGPVCALLRDPDLVVQAKAIETIVQINDPAAVHYLLDILQDESEYVRRAAVEVLNQVGNASAIKDLLRAMGDKDWWVRVRAADALGTIGGPKVAEAVLALVKDQDEFIRRSAIEILITIRPQAGDERIFNALVDALNDEDWWVRERAIDALAGLGDIRAVPALLRVMDRDVKAAPVAIRALASLGDPQGIGPLLAHLRSPEKSVRIEAMRALAHLTDAGHAAMVQRALTDALEDLPEDLRHAAEQSLRTIAGRFGGPVPGAEGVARGTAPAVPPSPVLLHDEAATLQMPSLMAEPGRPDAVGVGGQRRPSGPTRDAAVLEPGVVLECRYRVLRRIGSGAFGVVVLVDDQMVHEEIVLKFLKPHVASDEDVVKRFIQEVRFARKITHENVIRIFDFIAVGESYAISMEYFPSHALTADLTGIPMPIPRAFTILQGICRGMSVAHRAGIIHRDLKPANVLLNEHDLVKIVDFGVAAAGRSGDPRLTASGLVVGTPSYMAPEQAQGGAVDPRTDIYSLGVIMYEMLTGRPPYSGPDPMSILVQHVQGKATPPRQVNAGLSTALEATILKAMALTPGERHQSMEELGEALGALIDSEGS